MIRETASGADGGRLVFWAAGLSCGATLGHVIDAPDHLKEWWAYSTFFIVVAAIQLFYGVALFLRPWRYEEDGSVRHDADRYARPYYVVGMSLSASTIVLYTLTRTTGLPFFGPDAAVVESVGLLSLVPIAVEIALTACLGMLLRRAAVGSRVMTSSPQEENLTKP